MIIKKILVSNIEDAEDTVNQIFGPEAIILLTRALAPGKIELTVGYEKEGQKEKDPFMSLLYEDEDADDDEFWHAPTIPDVSYERTDVY